MLRYIKHIDISFWCRYVESYRISRLSIDFNVSSRQIFVFEGRFYITRL